MAEGEPEVGRFRAIWREIDSRFEGFLYLKGEEKESIKRHSLGANITHWGMVLFMFLAAVTGLMFWLGWYGPLSIGIWDGYYVAYLIHIWSGVLLAVFALILYPYFHLMQGEQVLLSREQIVDTFYVGLAFIGLLSYIPGYKQARRTYVEDEDRWAAWHPAQLGFMYGIMLFILILTLTGFALWAALATDPAWWVAGLGFMAGWFAFETLIVIHFIVMFLAIAMVMLHAYFPSMPSNWDLMRGRLKGPVTGWRVDSVPEPKGQAVSKDKVAPLFGWKTSDLKHERNEQKEEPEDTEDE